MRIASYLLFFLILQLNIQSCPFDDNHELYSFYANKKIQNHLPSAFALQGESKLFVFKATNISIQHARLLILNLRNDKVLYQKILNYAHLSIEEQIPVLKKVFEIEVSTLGIESPNLIIDTNYKKAAYFDFNLDDNKAGIVYINPLKTYKENPYSSLSLLLHETRHSYQIQLVKKHRKENNIFVKAYRDAFYAQKNLKRESFSFSDFLTLNNEYEAFLFGNYILNQIYRGRVDIKNMGTLASQFRDNGKIKLDLRELHHHSKDNIINGYNKRAAVQAKILGISEEL